MFHHMQFEKLWSLDFATKVYENNFIVFCLVGLFAYNINYALWVKCGVKYGVQESVKATPTFVGFNLSAAC